MKEVKYQLVLKALQDLKPCDRVLADDLRTYAVDMVQTFYNSCAGPRTEVALCGFSGIHNATKYLSSLNTPFIHVIKLIEEERDQLPETRVIPIDGGLFTVTRDGDGWGKPVPCVPAVGDELKLSELKEGDRVLIEADVFKVLNGLGYISVLFDKKTELFLDANQKVIYNGKSES